MRTHQPSCRQANATAFAPATISSTTFAVFISFNFDNDEDLKNLLVGQSRNDDSPFEITDVSVKEESSTSEADARRRIRRAEQVAVICGEHTDTATGVSKEIRIARDVDTPYFLLYGRASKTCVKPKEARDSDKMYKWTWDHLKTLISGGR